MAMAIVLASVLHVSLIFGLAFQAPEQPDYAPQIEVTLSTRPSEQRPDNARHKAQTNQQDSGDQGETPSVNAGNYSPPPQPVAQQQGSQQQASPWTEDELSQLSTNAAARRAAPLQQANAETRPDSPEQDQQLDPLAQELATLQAQLDEQSRAYSNLPRVKRLTSLAATESVDAAYLQDWRQRVEAVGNKYYPEASIRYGIYGSLRLLVVISHDGSLQEIRVLASSGYEVLDEAAIKIVRLAAPFAPFPAALRATTDRVEIIRTWQFQENRLSSGEKGPE